MGESWRSMGLPCEEESGPETPPPKPHGFDDDPVDLRARLTKAEYERDEVLAQRDHLQAHGTRLLGELRRARGLMRLIEEARTPVQVVLAVVRIVHYLSTDPMGPAASGSPAKEA